MLRVTFAKTCNLRLSSQRFEKQLKRFQSCVLCGSCSSMCGPRAISVNGRYTVDAHKCVGCMACVCGSCIGIESFTRKGTAQKWSVCSGSV
jgi:ferredoxin